MLDTKGGKIALLIFMAVVLVYTVSNYIKGQTNIVILGIAVFVAVNTGSRIISELAADFKSRKG